MNKILFLIMVIPYFAFSQQNKIQDTWHVTVIDSVTSKALELVTIAVKKKDRYFITDINGTIDINKTLINSTDTIRISSVGYNTYLIKSGIERNYPDTIRLSALVTNLNEVRISSSNLVWYKLGNIKKSYNRHWHANVNDEYGVFIPNEKKIKGTIVSVQYVVNDALHGITMPFKVELYSKSASSIFPDKELLADSVIVYNSKKEHLINVDLSKYDIQIPEDGFFVVFETLSPSFYSDDLVLLDLKLLPYGQKMHKVPGIDYDNNDKNAPIVVFDQQPKKGAMYSVTRQDKAHWENWVLFREGVDFAIGATIVPW